MATVNTFDSFDSTTFCLRSCEIIAMANDALTKSGLYLDELSKVKIVSPQTYQQSQELKEESVEFLSSEFKMQIVHSNFRERKPISEVKSFDSVVDNFIQLVDSLSKKVEQEKIRAIGSRNSLKTVSRQKQLEIQQLETLIHEKQIELER